MRPLTITLLQVGGDRDHGKQTETELVPGDSFSISDRRREVMLLEYREEGKLYIKIAMENTNPAIVREHGMKAP